MVGSKRFWGERKTRHPSNNLLFASNHNSNRRCGLTWSEGNTQGTNLHRVSGARPLKSCMAVTTIEDSLRAADENDKKRQQKRKAEGRVGNFSVIKKEMTAHASKEKGNSGGRRRSVMLGLIRLGASMSLRGSAEEGCAGGEISPLSEKEEMSPSEGERRIRFDRGWFRKYEVLATDNPGVSKGVSIGIGWNFEDGDSHKIDEYESTRSPRRKLKEIRLSEKERERRLLASGVTQSELAKLRNQISLAKGKRKETLHGLKGMEAELEMEGFIRKVKKILHIKKSWQKEEDNLWDKAQKSSSITARNQ